MPAGVVTRGTAGMTPLASPAAARAPRGSLEAEVLLNAKKKKKTVAHNPFAAKKVAAASATELDGWEMDDNIPDSRRLAFADSGHAPHLEEPEHFNRALADFVDELH